MPVQRTSCVHRGNTFYGDYKLVGLGSASEICVRYNGEDLCSRVGDRPPETIAEALLRELVVLEAVRAKVAEGRPGKIPLVGSDASERRAPRVA